jgi:hypothetical protein
MADADQGSGRAGLEETRRAGRPALVCLCSPAASAITIRIDASAQRPFTCAGKNGTRQIHPFRMTYLPAAEETAAAPNESWADVCALAADQPQSLSAIGTPVRRVMPNAP